jgi:O-antigen ligase
MVGIAVYGSFIVCLAVAGFLRPALAVVAVLLMFPLDQWISIEAANYIKVGYFTNVLIAGIVSMAFVRAIIKSKGQLFHTGSVFWLSAILIMYALFTTIWAPSPEKVYYVWKLRAPYILLFGFLATFLVRDWTDIKDILRFFLILGTPLAGLFDFYVTWERRGFLVDGSYEAINPLALAQFGGVLAIAAICLRGSSTKWMLLRGIAIALGLLLIVKTETRGQLVGAVFCLAFAYFVTHYRITNFRLVASLLAAAFVVVGAYYALKHDSTVELVGEITGKNLATGEATERMSVENAAVGVTKRWEAVEKLSEAWIASPLTIVFGLGNSASYSIANRYPHNIPLEILFEEGIVGLILYLALVVSVFRTCVYLLKINFPNGPDNAYVLVLPIFILYEFLMTLKQGTLISSTTFIMLIILLDRVGVYENQPQVNECDQLSRKEASPT